MSGDGVRIKTERRGQVSVVAVTGPLDLAGSAALTEHMAVERTAHPGRLVLDMSGVGHIDSGAAWALAAALSPAPGTCPVIMRSLRPAARRQLQLTGVDLASVEPGQDRAGPGPRDWDGFLAASATRTLVRRSQDLRTYSEQTIADSVRAAQSIASTEEKIAATLFRLATRRPQASVQLMTMSQAARSCAVQIRERARLAAVRAAATADPGTGNRHDAVTDTLGRAVAFIEERAGDDITVNDIAAAAFVTVRAIQLAFRRQLGTTPLGYLRQVRLERAHRQLLGAGPDRATVTMVATRWRFSSPSRFTAHYRAAYGQPPSQTLRHGHADGQRARGEAKPGTPAGAVR